jgi:CrcB protein
MKSILLVASGGAIGSVLRYLTALVFSAPSFKNFPYSTLKVNLLGCYIIGLIWAIWIEKGSAETLRLFLMIGILGGFTTFSSFGLESFQLIKNGMLSSFIYYILITNIVGILLVYGGYLTGEWMLN